MPLDTAENLRSRGICVIVPTYNNAGTIEDVVRRAFVFCKDVFVVVDGSTDDTVDRLKRLENQPNIIELPENTGKGNALRAGFRQARSAGFAYAITLDGDGQPSSLGGDRGWTAWNAASPAALPIHSAISGFFFRHLFR